MELGPNSSEERATDRRPKFLALDPAARTPVFVDDDGTIVQSAVIAEYLDETLWGRTRRAAAAPRGEARAHRDAPPRRLVQRQILRGSDKLARHRKGLQALLARRAARPTWIWCASPAQTSATIYATSAYLTSTRNWLAGDRLSYADFAAAAHISCADYLGDAPWDEDEAAKQWYQRIKSRPAFRPLLADRAPGMTPGPYYAELDF